MTDAGDRRMREFADPAARDGFLAAYRRVLDRWPVRVDPVDLESEFGRTRVHVSGPVAGAPLVLMHGYAATSASWFGVVGALAREHRVYAVDRIGDAGHSVHDGVDIGNREDLLRWLGTVLDGLGLVDAHLCGHSTGGWLSLALALDRPGRVRSLTLLDSPRTVAGFRTGYLLRALPALLRPTEAATRSYLDWETRGIGLDPDVRDLYVCASAHFPHSRIVPDRTPHTDRLRAMMVPTLVLLGQRSRCHDAPSVALRARRVLPHAGVDLLPGLTHHSIPTERPDEISSRMLAFLHRPTT